jgi:FkbM family methyltransferase
LTFISYAQNGEDVVLARAFGPDRIGFYVDIGASDPVVDSVTKHFYDQGWNGVNVEPASLVANELRAARPRDLTLELAIGSVSGKQLFYELPREMTGCSTFSESLAESYRREGYEVIAHEVSLMTLAQLCEEHVADRSIDFLKVDVEGAESEVLAGADFSRFRPRIVLVEATLPGTSVATYETWEGLLLRAGYEFVLFDGLNRFYVREEDAPLAAPLSATANVLDDYLPHRYATWRSDLGQARSDLETARSDASALEAALSLTRQELARSQSAYRDARTEMDAARAALRSTLAVHQQGCD